MCCVCGGGNQLGYENQTPIELMGMSRISKPGEQIVCLYRRQSWGAMARELGSKQPND